MPVAAADIPLNVVVEEKSLTNATADDILEFLCEGGKGERRVTTAAGACVCAVQVSQLSLKSFEVLEVLKIPNQTRVSKSPKTEKNLGLFKKVKFYSTF